MKKMSAWNTKGGSLICGICVDEEFGDTTHPEILSCKHNVKEFACDWCKEIYNYEEKPKNWTKLDEIRRKIKERR